MSGVEEEDEAVESMLFVHRSVNIYKIPPRVGLASYRAAEWKDVIATCRIKVLSRGKDATIRLEESHTGELFAETPVRMPLDKYVEPVLDSSRFFVLRLEEEGDKNHAFVGINFEERGVAFDFNVALQDHLRQVEREEKPAMDWGPSKDLSLKPGQSLQIKLKVKKSAASASASASSIALPLSGAAMPPPGGSKRRAQMEAAAAAASNSGTGLGGGDNDWADFGDFQAALPAAEGAADAGFGDFGDGFGGFADSGEGAQSAGDFSGFGDSNEWAKALEGQGGEVVSRGRCVGLRRCEVVD